jgi:aminoglycoside 3-N-acetyltransferase
MRTGPNYAVDELKRQLAALGVARGGVLVVHAAFSRIRPVEGGPDGLIEALLGALGPAGTLVMPSMSDDDEHVFDPAATPCHGLGVVADTFWRRPGVRRSDSPHAFAAFGPHAAQITLPHPVDVPHGPDSPIGRVHDLDGQVLLIGVGHDADTTLHLAENLAGVRYLRPKHATVLRDGAAVRVDYRELDHCCENFALADDWLDEIGLQRRGYVGHARARLARSRDIVRTATARLALDETVFLHAAGLCEECDDARAALREAADFRIFPKKH